MRCIYCGSAELRLRRDEDDYTCLDCGGLNSFDRMKQHQDAKMEDAIWNVFRARPGKPVNRQNL